MFDDMHNISRSQQVMIKTATMECFCVRLIILFTRFSVLLYYMPKSNINRILSKDNQVIYTLDTIYHDTSSRASPDILFSSNSF